MRGGRVQVVRLVVVRLVSPAALFSCYAATASAADYGCVCLQADIAVTTSSGEYVTATETEEVNQEQQQQLQQQQQQALWAQQQREAQRQHEQQQQRQQHEQQKQAQMQKQLQQQQAMQQEQQQTQQRLRQQFLQSPPPQLPSPPSDVTLNSALAAIPQAVAGAVEVAVAVAVNPGRPEDAQLYAGNAVFVVIMKS